MRVRKLVGLVLSLGAAGVLAACDPAVAGGMTTGEPASGTINVVTRENGAGTRGAFTEITGILAEDENGEEVDNTTVEAVVQNGTGGILSTVAQDPNAVGYVSLGSLSDIVKAVRVDGVAPTNETVQSGEFPISRNFNIAWSGDLDEVEQDFVNYMLSEEGQALAVEEGYVEAAPDAAPYAGREGLSGTLSVVGSTSVTPLMEVLAEEYTGLQPDVKIDITSNGSSAGMTAAIEGTADIGMASRELNEEEKARLTSQPIAVDGIVVVVNNGNRVENLTLEQVRQIFTGEITTWEEVQ